MSDQHVPSPATAAEVFGPLHGGERMMWQGRCGVAEYAFDEAASLPRWTLPESTDVLVTDHRVLYTYAAEDGRHVKSGELRWLWPQHLRVQPGARSRDRGAAATQIQLVCGGADGSFPALVFAGGDLATVGDADRLANVIRQAIARFRVDNADKIGLSAGQTRMLSRLLIGPEFRNHQGGEGQTVSLLGALLVNRPAPAAETAAPTAPGPPLPVAGAAPPAAAPAQPPGESGTRLINYRPGMAADYARALMAAKAEEAAQAIKPATASRAADLAARVANLVSRVAELTPEPAPEPAPEPQRAYPGPRHAEPRSVEPERFEVRTTNLAARAESVRRTAARMAANSARGRVGTRRADRDPGASTRANRTN
jgi:hypothetical protein